LIDAGGRDTRVAMLRAAILTGLAAVMLASVDAPAAAAEASSEDAPFAGGASKGPAPFAASPSAGFAAVGQFVLTMKTTGDDGYVFFHKPSGGDWTISLHPSLDYFLINSVSLGATFGYSYSPADTGTTAVVLGGRAGFNLNIDDHLGFWPTAGFSLEVFSSNHDTNTSTSFAIFAPFLYHLVPHLFAGVGPSFSARLSGGGGKTYGLDFVLGGWL
jgi:hypothetical protein